MKTLVIINLVVFAVIAGLAVGLGFDLKKRNSWLLGIYAFASFFLVGLVSTGNISESIKAGAFMFFIIMFGGMVMHWSRERAEKWLSDHSKEENN